VKYALELLLPLSSPVSGWRALLDNSRLRYIRPGTSCSLGSTRVNAIVADQPFVTTRDVCSESGDKLEWLQPFYLILLVASLCLNGQVEVCI